MKFKSLYLSLSVVCFVGFLCNAESNISVRNASSSVGSDGNANFTLQEGTVGKKVVIELSKYSDFSVIDGYGYRTPASFPTTISMSAANRVYGTYYWRIAEETALTSSYTYTYFYGNDRTVTYGSKTPTEYTAIEDSTSFENLELEDGRSLQLESVWFRSVNTGNKGFKIIDLPHATVESPMAPSVFTPDQGAIVKNDVIYISRGNSNWISGWRTDNTRVWLARFDLLSGEELPILTVKAPDPTAGFVSGNWTLYGVMNWIKMDDDGTPYFFAICKQSEKAYLSQINLYTLNLDNLSSEVESVTPTLTLQIEDNRSSESYIGYPLDFTVEGSIKSGTYKLWGIDQAHGGSLKVNSVTSGKMPIWQWNVSGSKAEKKVSYVEYVHSIAVSEAQYGINDFYPHFTPVGDDYFYFHSAPAQKDDPWISPMLYRFVEDGACEVKGHFGNSEDIVTKIFPMPAGVSTFRVEDMQFLAYGQGIDASRGSGIQIVSTPSLTDDFSAHNKVWMLGEKTGLSTNHYQSCQVMYIPDESEGSSATAGGKLLMYAANAGMGLYRLNILSPTVGVETISTPTLTAIYSDGVITLSGEARGIALYDIAGRRIHTANETSDTYVVGGLAKGCYILSTHSSAAPMKIIVR